MSHSMKDLRILKIYSLRNCLRTKTDRRGAPLSHLEIQDITEELAHLEKAEADRVEKRLFNKLPKAHQRVISALRAGETITAYTHTAIAYIHPVPPKTGYRIVRRITLEAMILADLIDEHQGDEPSTDISWTIKTDQIAEPARHVKLTKEPK